MLFDLLEVLTATLIAVAMSLSLAHALELPGKLRLTREAYIAVQPIYYPGFTIGGGIGETGGMILTIVLLCLTPRGTSSFWLTVVALLGLLGMQGVYWLVTHPVNGFWLQNAKLQGIGSSFFSFASKRSGLQDLGHPPHWTVLRDRWEYSHVIRAGLGFISMIAIVVALLRT
jgi:hypothetical protein